MKVPKSKSVLLSEHCWSCDFLFKTPIPYYLKLCILGIRSVIISSNVQFTVHKHNTLPCITAQGFSKSTLCFSPNVSLMQNAENSATLMTVNHLRSHVRKHFGVNTTDEILEK